jgi:enoyl-CoA hydratase/carnithine racemase
MSGLVLLAIDGPVATVTLNRADKRNAIAPGMLADFDAILSEVEASDAVRVLVVTGAGDRAFSAGADINAWSESSPIDMWRRWISPVNESSTTSKRFASLDRGHQRLCVRGARAGACLRPSSRSRPCDLRRAGDGNRHGSWMGATGRLAAIAGPARAKLLILTGEQIDAQTAATWGLVGEVDPAAEQAERARALAMQVADQAPIAVQIAKQLIDGQRPRPVIALEALGGGLTAFTTDAGEGRAAFRERRRPVYGDS